jgi:seryl-tRNA synthetase
MEGLGMLDIRLLRTDPARVRAGYAKKRVDAPLEEVLALDGERRRILAEVEQLKADRNRASEAVARLKKAGEPTEDLVGATRELGDTIARREQELKPVEERLEALLLELPNLPHDSVPEGAGEEDNPEVRRWGEPRQDSVAPHWDLGERLGIIDAERARKLSGSRFTVLTGFGAQLNRALINFMLDHALGRGYTEVAPPYLVLDDALYGTGQLPKFREDVFRVVPHGYYLIPTAEVPVTNLHRGEILGEADLPLLYCAYTASFRSEAGAAGRDTRGLIRLHQFDKVELVRMVRPEDGLSALAAMRRDAEEVLEQLNLPYRTVEHCSGDLGFGHHKAYDLEVWMPSYGRYVEISSVSLMSDFQARRMGTRYRPEGSKNTEFVYTLNGSALALGRTIAAILENFQTDAGGIRIPDVLQPYLKGRSEYPGPGSGA